jgi:ketosteroid isomerase-like protein
MPRKVDTIARYFRRFVRFSGEWKDYEEVLTTDFIQKEMPSPTNPQGLAINAAELMKRIPESRKTLAAQHFEVVNQLESDNQAFVEVVWTALLAADFGGFKKGKNIKSNVCMIFEFREEKILQQRIYDAHAYASGQSSSGSGVHSSGSTPR